MCIRDRYKNWWLYSLFTLFTRESACLCCVDHHRWWTDLRPHGQGSEQGGKNSWTRRPTKKIIIIALIYNTCAATIFAVIGYWLSFLCFLLTSFPHDMIRSTRMLHKKWTLIIPSRTPYWLKLHACTLDFGDKPLGIFYRDPHLFEKGLFPVSYTHLTLPTIYSV